MSGAAADAQSGFRPCVLIPTYDNPDTIAQVVESVRPYVPDVIVVDDGSHERARTAIDALGESARATVVRREHNGGKGAAVKTGLAAAQAQGYSHALQVDADGQHCVEDIPRFLDEARTHPTSLVLGAPQFGADAPRARIYGRQVSIGFVHLETGGRVIADPLCGFRVYPVDAALRCAPRADRMEFDPEIAVRMVWQGVPVRNLPTHVRYIPRDQGGVSHFQLVRDNVRISFMHSRLVCLAILRVLFGWLWSRVT
ncbi:MAG: glycosyltransferase family 2 protein [Polyangiales bacterium]